jgi:hypothetical protein
MTDQLQQAIRRYRKLTPEFHTRSGASGQCYEASYRFVNLLKGRGIEAQIVELILDERQARDLAKLGYVYPSLYDGYHYVVEVEHHLVDWTARQYRARAPLPVVIPLKEFRLDWGSRRNEMAFPRLVKK